MIMELIYIVYSVFNFKNVYNVNLMDVYPVVPQIPVQFAKKAIPLGSVLQNSVNVPSDIMKSMETPNATVNKFFLLY